MIKDQDIFQSRILLLDDNHDNLDLLGKILRRAGYQNLMLLSDSRQFAGARDEFNPDLILLDLMMPHLDGYQILKSLRETEEDSEFLPVIVITADVSKKAKSTALSSGANDFLTKPFDTEEVGLRVRNLLSTRVLHQSLRTVNKTLDEQNHVLDEKVRERTADLENARLEILHRLGKAAEYRDDDTGQHTQRVGRMTGRLAAEIGLPDHECRTLALAGPLHDVGKIGIPDNILLKPARLTTEEFEVMKTHTLIGARILSGSAVPILQRAEELALSHHEKWDGSGYPNGLTGEEIPLSGRILAVADVLDALTHHRPYRAAWPVSEAFDFIRSCSGAHFDPDLVRALDSVLQSGAYEEVESGEIQDGSPV